MPINGLVQAGKGGLVRSRGRTRRKGAQGVNNSAANAARKKKQMNDRSERLKREAPLSVIIPIICQGLLLRLQLHHFSSNGA